MKVLLFGTCLVGTFFPEAGEATVRLLRRGTKIRVAHISQLLAEGL